MTATNPDLPAGWTTDRIGSVSAAFTNDEYDLEVVVEPRYRCSASRRRRRTQQPKSYLARVEQDWFSTGVHGDLEMATSCTTYEDAMRVAHEMMAEFCTERATQDSTDVEATHRSVDDSAAAERLLTNEAAVGAFTDAAGYSDDLLLEVLDTQTEGQHRVVVHRDGERVEFVFGADDECLDALPLERVYATFPIDRLGMESILSHPERLVMVVCIGGYAVYRFVFSDGEETDVVLTRGTQVVSPTFERTVWNVLESKWH